MTGGQMADNARRKTVTCPNGRDRDPGLSAACADVASLQAPVFVERVALSDPKNIRNARRAVRKALEVQRDGKGYTFVEVLSPCPTNLRQSAVASNDFINEQMIREYPLGNFRDRTEEAEPVVRPDSDFTRESLDALFELDSIPASIPHDDAEDTEAQVKIAGFGGQGVLSLGIMLTEAAMLSRFGIRPTAGTARRRQTAR